ncbi:MAG: RtcB family protein [Candidatus Altiarchaeota archaeon]|nr:RtcB family protein [Candidatus Altiarchaeota archaeon]
MNVPVKIHASKQLLEQMHKDRTFQQIVDVTTLPGIYKHAVLLPDGHEGYGFPIGGVAAFKEEGGIVSPGGIGYDINCGVRLLISELSIEDVKGKIPSLLEAAFQAIPSGLGKGATQKIGRSEFLELISKGVKWADGAGFTEAEDSNYIEERGSMPADPSFLSQKSIARGLKQVGTLGAGNHFLEVQRVDKIFGKIAEKFGLCPNQIVIMVHTGSRGFGHQVADDYIKIMLAAASKYGVKIPNNQLSAAPLHTPEAEKYIESMKCAVNFAFVNRQKITFHLRNIFEKMFGSKLKLLYDVAHNIGKYEIHGGEKLFIHRKGATRAFGPGRDDLPDAFQKIGQPVITPGSMGTASYVMVGLGNPGTFESTCHGAGRVMSRGAAMRKLGNVSIKKKLEAQGIDVRTDNLRNLAQEAPQAYKDIDDVVKTVYLSKISAPVARLLPLGVVKG